MKAGLIIKKIVAFLNKIEIWILAYASILLTILITGSAIGRKFGFQGFFWIEEYGRLTLILITFLGASVATKYGSHLSMDTIFVVLPKKFIHALKAGINFISGIFIFWVDYYAWVYLISLQSRGMTFSSIAVPYYIAYIPLALFFFTMAIRFILVSITEYKLIYSATPANEAAVNRGPL